MGVGINAGLIYASIRDRNQNQADRWADGARGSLSSGQPSNNSKNVSASGLSKKNSSSTRAMEYQQRMQDKAKGSVINQSMSYADALRASRTKANENNLEKKKLQYSYKKISSQIVRSKTSISARKAASAARREVQRLKRLRSSGEYDEEELQISIEHAKSMERVAKKKVAHLQQEEMIERGQNGALASLEEKEEEQKESEETTEDELSEEELQKLEEEMDPSVYYPEDYSEEVQAEMESHQEEFQYQMAEIQEEMEARMEELSAQMQQQIAEVQESQSNSMDEMMSDMMKMVSDAMEEMTEELDLTELANTIVAPDPDMSEDDLKMLKMKHRTKEMKDIAKADGDYLKAIMDKYEKKGVAGMGIGGQSSAAPAFGGSAGISSSPTPVTLTVATPYGSGGESISFDAFV